MSDASKHPDWVDPNVIANRLLQRAHNRDGLPEIRIGLFFLMISGLSYAFVVLPKGTLGYGIAVLTFSFGLPVLFLGTKPLICWVRRQYLIQREGYVQYRPMDRKHLIIYIELGLTLAVLLAILALVLPPLGSWYVACVGILVGLSMAICGRLPRLVFAGVLMALAGVPLAFIDIPVELGMAALFGFDGVVALLSGGVTLVHLLNQTPIGAESDECRYPADQRN
jgi:hypothetical protein